MPGPRLDIGHLNSPASQAKLRAAHEQAACWAEHGYSQASRSYWLGMQQTLAVLLGRTVTTPALSSDDPAALTLLGG